jgi:glucose-1-phosphate cytidylyltransferase
MKAVILAGGFGTRLSEETHLKPKPLVEIGGRPIIWHIMKYLNSYGIKDFVICCGYKGYMIKEYFKNYNLHTSDIIFDISNNTHKIIKKSPENWNVACIDTGEDTMTGGRLK